MRLGVTGTREGMTEKQIAEVHQFLLDTMPDEIHHGDCEGVDIQVAIMADMLGIKTICHPPESDYLRAFHKSVEIREKKDYHTRDKHIVDESEFMMVIPLHDKWQPSGGTWFTHNHAVKTKTPFKIFWPTKTGE